VAHEISGPRTTRVNQFIQKIRGETQEEETPLKKRSEVSGSYLLY